MRFHIASKVMLLNCNIISQSRNIILQSHNIITQSCDNYYNLAIIDYLDETGFKKAFGNNLVLVTMIVGIGYSFCICYIVKLLLIVKIVIQCKKNLCSDQFNIDKFIVDVENNYVLISFLFCKRKTYIHIWIFAK